MHWMRSGDDTKCCGELALFPGLPTVQFLIACSMQKQRGTVEGLGTRLAVNIEKIDVARNCNESMQRNTYSSWCRFGGSRASSPLCPSFFFASPCSAKYSNLFSVSNLSWMSTNSWKIVKHQGSYDSDCMHCTQLPYEYPYCTHESALWHAVWNKTQNCIWSPRKRT